jgi:hypothetical protein
MDIINQERVASGQKAYTTEEFYKKYGKQSGVTVNVGKDGTPFPAPPPGQAYRRDENQNVLVNDKGEPQLYDLPGGDAALARKEQEAKIKETEEKTLKGARERTREEEAENVKARGRYATVSSVVRSVDELKKIVKEQKAYWPSTGFGSSIPKMFGGSGAVAAAEAIRTTDANVAFSQLQKMRDASTTGSAGLGSVTDFEHGMLKSVFASLNQSLDDKTLISNANYIKAAMIVLAENDFKKGGKVSDAEATKQYTETFQKVLKEIEAEDGPVSSGKGKGMNPIREVRP